MEPSDDQGSIGLPPGAHDLALDVDVLLVPRAIGALHQEVCLCKLLLDIATLELQAVEGLLSARGRELQNGLDGLVAHLDGGQRLAGGQSRRRCHDRYRLPDVLDEVRRQHGPFVIEELDAVRSRQIARR